MALRETTPLVGNGPSVQLYVPKNVCQDPRFPFAPEDTATVVVLPDLGFLVIPAEETPEWPLTVSEPRGTGREPVRSEVD